MWSSRRVALKMWSRGLQWATTRPAVAATSSRTGLVPPPPPTLSPCCQRSRSIVSATGGTSDLAAQSIARRLAGLSGALAVAVGAGGAHVLPKRLRSLDLSIDEQKTYLAIFGTASQYHLLHAAVLLCTPFARFPRATAGLLVAGKVFFVGSLYTVAYTGSREVSVANAAPVGGGLLILGWLSFVL